MSINAKIQQLQPLLVLDSDTAYAQSYRNVINQRRSPFSKGLQNTRKTMREKKQTFL